MACVAVELAYDGSAYSGFAKQKDSQINTIQGKLESALEIIFRKHIDTVCAGRTDAGVHALGQVISFDIDDDFDENCLFKLKTSLDALTPHDIAIKQAWLEHDGFSARFDADMREYRYRICTGPQTPLFLRNYAWWHRGLLDVDVMKEAAQYLIGEHDFKSFCKVASALDKNTVRTVYSIDIFEEVQLGEECLCVQVIGNAFLHSMIRTIVGTLVEVGEGKRESAWVSNVLAACNRNAAGQNAPACGLVFHKVTYKPQGK